MEGVTYNNIHRKWQVNVKIEGRPFYKLYDKREDAEEKLKNIKATGKRVEYYKPNKKRDGIGSDMVWSGAIGHGAGIAGAIIFGFIGTLLFPIIGTILGIGFGYVVGLICGFVISALGFGLKRLIGWTKNVRRKT